MQEPSQPKAPRWGLVLLLVGLALRILISGRIHPLSNPALLILFAGLLLLRRPGRGRGFWIPQGLEFAFLLFLGAAGLSVPLGLLPRAGWDQMLTLLGHLCLVLALLRWLHPEKARTAAGVMVLAGLLSATAALRQYFGGFAQTLKLARPTDPYVVQTLLERRVFGLTFSPDMFAALMAMLIPLSLALALALRAGNESPPRWRTALLLLPAALLGVPLILSRSLGGSLAAAAGLLVFFLLAFRELPPRPRRISLAVVLLALAAGLAWIGLTRGHYFVQLHSASNPIMFRLQNWRTALAVAAERPASGVGLGNFGLAYMAHRVPAGNEVQDAHNNYLQVLAETGPVGLLGFVGLALIFLAQGWRQARRPGAWMAKGILAAGAVFLAHSMIDFDLYVSEVAGVWWTLVGLQALLAEQADPAPDRSARFTRAALAALLVCAMAAGAWLMMSLTRARDAEEQMAAQNYPAAVKAWESAVRLDPHHDLYQARLALARSRAGNLDVEAQSEIIKGYRLAQELSPRNPFYHQELAEFYRGRKQLRDAESESRRAVALYPNSYELNAGLGQALLEEKKWPEAEAVLDHALACSLFNYGAATLLAEVMVQTGRPDQADSLLRENALKHPDLFKFWSSWAWFWFQKKQGDKVQEACAEVIRHWPQRAECYDLLALLAEQRNDREKALDYAAKALRLDPEDSTARTIQNRFIDLDRTKR
jgi:tetratricopeptide (TPR) repeat protein